MRIKWLSALMIFVLFIVSGCTQPPIPGVVPEKPDISQATVAPMISDDESDMQQSADIPEIPDVLDMQQSSDDSYEIPPVPTMPEFDEPSQNGADAFDRPAFEMNTQWPDIIPDIIPPIPANITFVMEGGNRIRIFFDSMSRNQLEAYLQTLQQNGFQLEFVVYTQEGFTDNSEERIQKGEYDAVRITDGTYSMTIEHGEDMGTYDIDTNAF